MIKKWTIIRFPLAWSLHSAQGGVFTKGEVLYMGMKFGSVFLFPVLEQILRRSKAQYQLHKLLSAASDAQALLKQQAGA